MALSETLWLMGFQWRRRALSSVFNTLARLGEYTADVRAAKLDVETIADVPYGPHPVAHRLDIFRPRDVPRPLPVMLYIHGGGFVMCSKDTHRGIAMMNAQRAGYLVFNINYRLAPEYPYPAAIADACEAYRFVVRNASRYGGDPARIVVAGESAGGNLALGVAIATTYPRPEPWAQGMFELPPPLGLMPVMPFLQVTEPWRRDQEPGVGRLTKVTMHEIARKYLGTAPLASSATLMADPIRVLEECGPPKRDFPRIFTGAGTADPCCNDVRRLQKACRALHLPIQVAYFRDEVHAFHALHWRSAARRLWRRNLAFLQRLQRPHRPRFVPTFVTREHRPFGVPGLPVVWPVSRRRPTQIFR